MTIQHLHEAWPISHSDARPPPPSPPPQGESETPVDDYLAINNELALYSQKLGRTPQVVVLTKTDLPHVAGNVNATLAALRAAMPHQVREIVAHSVTDDMMSRM